MSDIVLEYAKTCWSLAREAIVGRYRTNTNPIIAALWDSDDRVVIGAILMTDAFIDTGYKSRGMLASIRARRKGETHPILQEYLDGLIYRLETEDLQIPE